MTAGATRSRPPHLAFGSDGSVFLDVRALRSLGARLRGRRRFVGIELTGRELALVHQVMNETGAFNAAGAVVQMITRRRL